jgi:hypothetical protein
MSGQSAESQALHKSGAQFFVKLESVSMNKIASQSAPFPLHLKLQQFQGSAVAAAYKQQTIVPYHEFGRRYRSRVWVSFQDLEVFPTELCISARPRPEAPKSVENVIGGEREIDEAVLFLQNRCKCRLRIVLRILEDRTLLQPLERIGHQVGPDRREARRQGFGGVVHRYRQFALQKDIARIDSGVEAHCSYASDSLASGDRPLDGGSAAVLGKKRCMQVDIPQPRKVKHPWWNNAAVPHNDNGIRLQCCESGVKFFVAFDAFRLRHRNLQLQGGLLDGRGNQFKSTSFGPVGLGYNQTQTMSRIYKSLKSGYGEARSTGKNEIQRHFLN